MRIVAVSENADWRKPARRRDRDQGSLSAGRVTGASLPAERSEGDTVIGATVNTTGSFTMRATKVGRFGVVRQGASPVQDS
jgi:Cu+-exporting ATPase